jgi:predicted phosphodiesterase
LHLSDWFRNRYDSFITLNLVIPDTHRPRHDKRAVELVHSVGRDLKPDIVTILGDYVDAESVSSFPKDPDRHQILKEEIDDANRGLDEFDEYYPKARKIMIEGNHEERLSRFVRDKAPALYSLAYMPDLLRLHTRGGWEWVKYGKHVKIGKLLFTHGTIVRVNTSAAMLQKYEHSVCFGHIHRIEESLKVNALGEAHVAFTPGWLGDVAQVDYVKDFANWQLGFALVYHLDNGEFFHTTHKIVNYKTVVNGKLYGAPKKSKLMFMAA